MVIPNERRVIRGRIDPTRAAISPGCLCRALALTFALASPMVAAQTLHFLALSDNDVPVADAVISLPADQRSSPAPAYDGAPAIMDQVKKQFRPRILAVAAGAQVAFPNSDNVRHHVYSFSPAKVFELKLYSGQPEAPLLFQQPGVVVLGCNIHDSMLGYIYVAETPYFSQTDASGKATLTFPDAKPAPQDILVWSPELSIDSQTILRLSLSELPTSAADRDAYIIRLNMQGNGVERTQGKSGFGGKFRKQQHE
ncbi:methylamine utilization protein [Hahella sp. HN01]|uniref:methylamine utilization protein n=1 Tax=Hahella sp. HN01 TaxID=2847262 RepID=UPI001C1EB53B|nr:methylamine utilization protein [Hahella sp. HN01]MBU6953792.1 methylamine utilization protein [Hahella sp. HN01]